MILTTFHPSQNEELLMDKVSSFGNKIHVLSYKEISHPNTSVFSPGRMPPPDDALVASREYLLSLKSEEINQDITLIDWESVFTISSYEKDINKLKKVNSGIEIVEENIAVQDFRLAPYMENLLKICSDLRLNGADRLFKTNPNLLVPRMIKGNGFKIVQAIDIFLRERAKISSLKFTGVLPIFNSEFKIQ